MNSMNNFEFEIIFAEFKISQSFYQLELLLNFQYY